MGNRGATNPSLDRHRSEVQPQRAKAGAERTACTEATWRHSALLSVLLAAGGSVESAHLCPKGGCGHGDVVESGWAQPQAQWQAQLQRARRCELARQSETLRRAAAHLSVRWRLRVEGFLPPVPHCLAAQSLRSLSESLYIARCIALLTHCQSVVACAVSSGGGRASSSHWASAWWHVRIQHSTMLLCTMTFTAHCVAYSRRSQSAILLPVLCLCVDELG